MSKRRTAKASSKRSGGPDFAMVHARLQDWLDGGHEARFRIGTLLVAVHDRKLQLEAGFPTFHAYLDSLTTASRRTWQRYMALARQVDPFLAFFMEADRLELAVRLLGGGRRHVYVSAATLQTLEIEVLRGRRRTKVAFEAATDEELAAAVAGG